MDLWDEKKGLFATECLNLVVSWYFIQKFTASLIVLGIWAENYGRYTMSDFTFGNQSDHRDKNDIEEAHKVLDQ